MVLQLLIAVALWAAPPAAATHAAEQRFWTFVVDPVATPIVLLHERPDGGRFGSLGAVADDAAKRGERLVFATNGGMYRPDRTPVGLYVERGRERSRLVGRASSGNFGWKPNGVFVVRDDGRAAVVTTERYTSSGVAFATQSGPMLLSAGVMHRGFAPDSRHVAVRSGVGVLPDGRVAFVMSKGAVTFHAFASYFALLGCRDALYLDGNVSRLYWPEGGVEDRGGDFGVIITVFARGLP